MRLRILKVSERRLAQGAAIIFIGGLVSGCSSDAMRFSYDADGMFTGATTNQRQIIAPNQPYPGNEPTLDSSHTGSVARQAVTPVDLGSKPVAKSALPPIAGTTSAPADSKPLVKLDQAGASRPEHKLDATTTATIEPQAATDDPVGWSRAGGTQVTAKEGETVYNLSKRFGVPADVLMKMNGISEASGLKVGQKVIIATYVYNSKAPVSAPDNNPKVAGAKSSKGEKQPADKLPAGDDKVAVLPKSPKQKEGEAAQGTAVTATDKAAKPVAAQGAKPAAGTYTVASGDTLSK